MDDLEALLAALHHDPADETAWLALADCLEEQGQPQRAELTRLQQRLHTTLRARHRARSQRRVQELLATGVRPCMPTLSLRLDDQTSLDLVLLPPGSFFMGSSAKAPQHESDEHPRHKVTLTRPFYMGV